MPEDGKEILGKGKDLIRIQGVHSGRKQYERPRSAWSPRATRARRLSGGSAAR